MHFSDHALSKRLERAEGHACVLHAEAPRRLFPDSGAECGSLYGKVCDVRCRPIYLSPKFLIKKTPLQLKTAGEFSVLVLCFRRERTIPGFGNAFEKGSAVASIAHLRRWPLLW